MQSGQVWPKGLSSQPTDSDVKPPEDSQNKSDERSDPGTGQSLPANFDAGTSRDASSPSDYSTSEPAGDLFFEAAWPLDQLPDITIGNASEHSVYESLAAGLFAMGVFMPRCIDCGKPICPGLVT